nr:formylglycine-generating enzyme family protein [Pseudoxanthomonas kalamensis]
MRLFRPVLLLCILGLAACRGDTPAAAKVPVQVVDAQLGSVTVSGTDTDLAALNWTPPAVDLGEETPEQTRRRAAQALAEGRLYEQAEDAIPLYLALLARDADDRSAQRGIDRAVAALLKQGGQALQVADEDAQALRRAGEIAAVLRTLRGEDAAVTAYLDKVDQADYLWRLNDAAERDLRAGQLGETGGGALGSFREVLAVAPGQSRAQQGLAAVESAMIRRAEDAARNDDFVLAGQWLAHASQVRPDTSTLGDAHQRVEDIRTARIAALRDEALAALSGADGLTPLALRKARETLAEVLRIALPGDAVAADLRQRIDLATYYGLFRPGQSFTEALANGGRGPEMIVLPHGAFRMGAPDDELGASDSEKPAHYVRFERGFAMSRKAVTVGEFRRFVQATDYRPRASRRELSIVYDLRSGNFVRRGGADWRSDYMGAPAADDQPVLHVSVYDAEAYAEWLAAQTGSGYRLPTEAEFEYASRAGREGRYPWGNGQPPPGTGNLTGGNDVAPNGRHWSNAFVGYGDGYWGPAPVATFQPNAWGLYDLGSNISEWVADCWHASYRRAPADGRAWFNPGCRARVVRGGSWSSGPVQTRAAWRSSVDSDMTSARIGFRVVRGI